MAEPPDADSLFEAIRNLMATLERARQYLDERAQELSAEVDRISTRSDGLVGLVQALQQQGQELVAETEELSKQQTDLSLEIVRLEQRLNGQDQALGDALDTLPRIHAFEDRLGALERRMPEEAQRGEPREFRPEPAPAAAESAAFEAAAPSPVSPSGRPYNLTELSERLDRLERKEEVLLRIIELVVERDWIVARRNTAARSSATRPPIAGARSPRAVHFVTNSSPNREHLPPALTGSSEVNILNEAWFPAPLGCVFVAP